jgi:4-diphosphocytidyl-2-C-methyl-D-erythritol kinase
MRDSYEIRVRAFAKINLMLRVLGRRADGYHELRTTFQSLALHDTLTIRRERGPFRIECGDADVPTDASNLIARAAAAMWRAAGRRGAPHDVVVALVKNIPIAAGLGGGSSDAAATLRGLARLWRIDEADLPRIAAALGADVPYFLEGGTALGLDRGDTIFPLIDHPPAWVALVVPPFGVSTKDAYGWLDRDRRARRRRTASPGNDLEQPVVRRHREIGRIVAALRRCGATHAAMSGSGSAVFGLFARRADAIEAAGALAGRGRRALVTRTLARGEYRALAAK